MVSINLNGLSVIIVIPSLLFRSCCDVTHSWLDSVTCHVIVTDCMTEPPQHGGCCRISFEYQLLVVFGELTPRDGLLDVV